ncbi:Uncharacterized protein APZ42_030432 [Daphnia magna]|uniref:Uncharacterized protein n=1 Tax=Daphnia magna TaxID=35525 RepID=A0A164NS22_9CRUS|nr:Uncharacterized protein APZ42_030432 [Daphnia magna]
MVGPGSGNRGSASRGGSRAGSRGGSRGGSRSGSRGGLQVRGRGRATAPTIQEQFLYKEEEEDRFRESHQQKRCHEEEYNKVKTGGKQIPSNQSCMKDFLATKVQKDTQKKIDILLAEMIVMDNLPFTVLQQDGFRRLISFIVPTYNIPTWLGSWGSHARLLLLTTSRLHVFFNMKEMPSNHTTEAILSECVVSDWELNGKVVRTVTDNALNKTKAFRLQLSNFILEEKEDAFIEMELEAGLEVPNYFLIPEYLECTSSAGGSPNDELEIENLIATSSHAGCLPHQTQLVIKDGLKALEKFVSKSLDLLCMIVGVVRRSVVDTQVLLDSVGFKIPMMNLTRWNSQFSMVKHFLNGIYIDTALQSKLNACKAHGSLSSLQLKCLKEFVTLLEPFKIATDVFQKDTETIGLVIPFYLDLVN